jgi:hypothetical protein
MFTALRFAHLTVCDGNVPSNPRIHVDDAVAAKDRQKGLDHQATKAEYF